MPAADLDATRCYDALASRDGRFDGRFWVGVRTTGVYCRPVCPSRTPRAANVAFFAHPAAAEADGFRPCRRCRPDAAPGSPAWRGGAEVVDRALRLIEAGALDGRPVADLAARLHVGERHLRRLFASTVGTTPDVVARSRRAHLARHLLVDTDLSVADVAFAAGFGSVRQCNDVVRATFHRTPRELRSAGAGARRAGGEDGTLTLRLPVRAPFDGVALLDWFQARAVDGLEVVDGTTLRRGVAVDGGVATVALDLGSVEGAVPVTVDAPARTALGTIVAAVRRVLDLDADPDAVDAHLALDPLLAPLVARRPGIRVPGSWTGFEAGVRAVVGQQISVAAARTVLGRIVAAHGTACGDLAAFPEPEAVVDAPLETHGIIGSRATTIRTLARAVLDGDVVLDGSVGHDDLVASLTSLSGIGPWTASYVALRLGEPDAFPAGDLHLARMIGAGSEREARRRAEPWRPWRAAAAMHLWQTPLEERP